MSGTSGAVAFPLPDEIEAVVGGIESFVKAEVIPRHDEHHDLLDDVRLRYDANGCYSAEVVDLIKQIRRASADAGYFNLAVPESMGGGGLGHLAYYAAWERIYHLCGGTRWLAQFAISHWAFGPSVILEDVTERAASEVLPGFMSGEKMMCFGMSEPDAGSDATRLRTRAVPDSDGWLISGRKIWTTHVPIAEWMIVLAITDADRAAARRGGISAFLVPTDADGFAIEQIVRMWGEPGGPEAESVFDEVRVEPWQLVGELHEGFQIGLKGVSLGRVYNSARSVGLSRWAIEQSVAYAQQREAFGKTISEYQGVSLPLADAATEIHAAHLLGLNAASLLDQGHRAIKELSMAKAYSVQAGLRAIDRAIQTHGAMGFTNELGLAEAYHTIRLINVADGTNEILARTIFQRMANGDLDL
ncbi:MAG: acyl-CoA/acyl-ACP dehydrogenase [Actinomycetia bacterium]|nr:acyl-CoA/acyl-ACP dehydrogenase [Actinomycetes bacterium]MCP3911165.1 acyl-CoA/acyl-ACP dehydrogenase [Actinomycetes bacterium]MCP4083901.1 acyl-CoA/acyl-ACP dehydrogenase [Actinomycetes bacterium]